MKMFSNQPMTSASDNRNDHIGDSSKPISSSTAASGIEIAASPAMKEITSNIEIAIDNISASGIACNESAAISAQDSTSATKAQINDNATAIGISANPAPMDERISP
jgi:hypothetical protein